MRTEKAKLKKYLTPKQYEIFILLSKKYTKEQIIAQLNIEKSTFNAYRYNLRKTLEDNNFIEKKQFKKDYSNMEDYIKLFMT